MSAPQPPPNVPPEQNPYGPTTGPQPPAPPATQSSAMPPAGPGQPAPAQPAAEPAPTPYGFDDKGRVKRTKISGVWIGLIAAALVLILLIIFIAQNLDTVGLHFLGFYGQVSVGLALLVAALCGVLIAAVPGTIRILQLRRSLRRNADSQTKRP